MKKKFRFRLEVVERVRAEKEQQLLRVLAHAQKKVLDCQLYRRELDQRLQDSLVRREQLAAAVQDIQSYQLESQFVLGQKARIAQADQGILRARRQLEKVLREYLMAKRALRAVEILREKAYEEYKLALRKREQKETEELYTMRAGWHDGMRSDRSDTLRADGRDDESSDEGEVA